MLQRVMKSTVQQEPINVTQPFDMQPITATDGQGYSEAVQTYFSHYGLGMNGFDGTHLFGTFSSGPFSLAGHLYCPRRYRATVVLVHGYLNHSGQFKHLIAYLLEQGYAVGVFDLPGHGLSSGPEAGIDTFSQYTRAVEDFMAVVQARLNGPTYAVGFSLGGAILMEQLRLGQTTFAKTVLAAPLVHWTLYEQSKGTYKVYSRFTNRIARFHHKNSSDRDYLMFNRTQDYLHCQYLSLNWVKALFDWNECVHAMGPCQSPVLVIQGDRDRTVEWRYNLAVIEQRLVNARIEVIPEARHELFNEAEVYRRAALTYVGDYLRTETRLSKGN